MIGFLFLAIFLVLSIWLAILIVRMWKDSSAEMERRSRRRRG